MLILPFIIARKRPLRKATFCLEMCLGFGFLGNDDFEIFTFELVVVEFLDYARNPGQEVILEFATSAEHLVASFLVNYIH